MKKRFSGEENLLTMKMVKGAGAGGGDHFSLYIYTYTFYYYCLLILPHIMKMVEGGEGGTRLLELEGCIKTKTKSIFVMLIT